jgi:hypothetical protein
MILASIIFATSLSKMMDARVKPGDDDLKTDWLFDI